MLLQILTECHQQNVGIIIITRGVWGGHILDQFVQSTNTKPNIPGVMAYNWNSQFYIWMDWKWVNISCDISPTPQPYGNWYFGPFWTEIWLYHAIYIFTLFTQVFKQDFRTWKCCFSSDVLSSHCPRAVFVIDELSKILCRNWFPQKPC